MGAIVLESDVTGKGGTRVLLEGIRVVEAASMVLVPSAAAMLADFGAEVIKVEPPEGDYNRRMHELPALPRSDKPYCFLVDSRSKRSVVLDLKSADGVAILHRLVRTADVFLTNYRAPALERLRLRWEDLAPLNARLVYASASAFGESGPEADKPGYDTVVYWARSGLESSLLTPEGTLGQLPGGAGDHPTALALFGAVTLGLFARERTGRGLKVSTSLLAAGAWANAWNIQAQLCGATFPPKLSRSEARTFGVYYRTRDGRVLKFALVNPERLWPRFCHAVGRPEFVKDPRFADGVARQAHAQALIAILDEIFASEDAAHWKTRFEAHDIPFAILPTYEDVARDPQMRANGMVVEFEHPRFGRLETVDSPISVAGVAKSPPRAAPELGQHTREVLAGLGYTEAQIGDFLAQGVAVQR
jgi:crotonobetainyl-CoA:carnitine CoA-transferase CaiB-like acyl-CoA transferase